MSEDHPDLVHAPAGLPSSGEAVLPGQDEKAEIAALGIRIRALQIEAARLQRQADDAARENQTLQQQKASLERSMTRAHAEIERWRLLARDMADQLWELGQMVKGQEALTDPELKAADAS